MEKSLDTGITQEAKDKIIGIIHALIPHCKIYLFGSRARGTHAVSSDVDLALDTGTAIEPRRKVGEVQEVLKGLYTPYTIEVVDFHSVTDTMQHLILQEGIPWSR
ncbi:nucleotidyltransferase domain-containing protein [Candidatus Dependentiae bacterium]|nr:nucleotidyltransferase domain-containing protein [Candidatus Dependentiae bacterium]